MSISLKYRFAALTLSAFLSACGGGGGDNSSNSGAGSTLSGAVMDGYLKGATVCLDLNANLVCDSTEPTATTDASGRYSLTVPTGTDTSNLHVIAIIDSKAIDADTGLTPDKPYTLMAPATAASAVSPLTTFISHSQIQSPLLTLDQATSATVADLGLPTGTDIRQNYVANNKADLHRVAQLTASLMGETISGVTSAANPSSTDQKREALLIALDYAKTQAGVYAKSAMSSTDADLKSKIAEAAAKAKKAVDDDKDNLGQKVDRKVDQRKGVYADIATIFKDGTFSLERYLEISQNPGDFKSASLTEYSVEKFENNLFTSTTYFLQNGQWTIKTPTPAYYFNPKTSTWSEDLFSSANFKISSDGKTRQGNVGAGLITVTERFKEIDVAGKAAGNFGGILWGYCREFTGFTTICGYLKDKIFPASSKIYSVEGKFVFDQDYFEYQRDCYVDVNQNCSTQTLSAVIDSGHIVQSMRWFFKATSKDGTSGTLTFYDIEAARFNNSPPSVLGTGTYLISAKGDRKLFTITDYTESTPGSLVSTPSFTPLNATLVEDSTGIYEGTLVLKGIISNGGEQNATNRTAMNALLGFFSLPDALK